MKSDSNQIDKDGIGELLRREYEPLLERFGRIDDPFDKVEDLNGLPCMYIVCETGRMGDTFPRSMLHYDLRLRYTSKTSKRSSFEQDVGRAFRYAKPGEQLPIVLIGTGGYELAIGNADGVPSMDPDAKMRKRQNDAVWSNTDGDPYTSKYYRKMFKPARSLVGV